jgi:Flp pilus assembly protein TadG
MNIGKNTVSGPRGHFGDRCNRLRLSLERSSSPVSTRSRRVSQRGAALVETTLSVPLLFSFVFFAISFADIMHQVFAIDYAVQSASRFATIGGTIESLSREASIRKTFEDTSRVFHVPMTGSQLSICPQNVTCNSTNAGGPGQTIVLNAVVPIRILFYRGAITYRSSHTTVNEFF